MNIFSCTLFQSEAPLLPYQTISNRYRFLSISFTGNGEIWEKMEKELIERFIKQGYGCRRKYSKLKNI